MFARRVSAVLSAVFAAWLAALPASAQPDAGAPPPIVPPEAIRSEHRIPGLSLDTAKFPGNATVITAEEIRRSNASTIQEVLAKAEGVTILDARGFGLESDSTLNLRGVNNGSRTNALVLVDGVRQNRMTGDEVHWQSIPVDQIERIEIIRGGAGTIYGEGALAGVINIFTKHGGERPLEAESGVEVGSYGWQRYSVAARGSERGVRYGTSYTRRLLDGYRDFSASRNTTVTAHGGVDVLPGARAELNVLHSADTTNYPGSLKLSETEQKREQSVVTRARVFEEDITQVGVDLIAGPVGGLSWLISTFWRDHTADERRGGLFTLTPSRGLNIRSSHEWTGGQAANTLVSGFELLDEKASTGTRGGARTDESNRQGYGLYLEDTLTFWDRLTLVGGFRYDRSRFEEDIVAFDSLFNEVNYVGALHFEGKSPKVGATFAVIPDAATVFASYSRPFKSPNVDDFASRSSEFQGNIALQPQQGNAFEMGARGKLGPLTMNSTWFYGTVKDEILFVQGIPGNPFIFQNQNFDTKRFGVENALRFEAPNSRVRGYATYTYVNAQFHEGQFVGNTLPGTPAHTFNTGLGVSPLASFWVDLDWQLISGYFRINDVANILPADNYGVLNLSVRYELPARRRGWPAGTVYLKIQNLTSEEYVAFQSSNGHTLSTGAGENPMPPINFMGGIRLQF